MRRALLVGFVALLALASGTSTTRAQTLPPALTTDALRNSTYALRSFEPIPNTVTLVDGRFAIPLAPGLQARATVNFLYATTGLIGGAPMAAVVLYSAGGGSGGIFSMHLMDARGKQITYLDTGDRQPIDAVAINDVGHLVLDLHVHGPTDPACCASVRESREYALSDSTLVRVDVPRPASTGTGGLHTSPTPPFVAAAILIAVLLSAVIARRQARR